MTTSECLLAGCSSRRSADGCRLEARARSRASAGSILCDQYHKAVSGLARTSFWWPATAVWRLSTIPLLACLQGSGSTARSAGTSVQAMAALASTASTRAVAVTLVASTTTGL